MEEQSPFDFQQKIGEYEAARAEGNRKIAEKLRSEINNMLSTDTRLLQNPMVRMAYMRFQICEELQ